LRRVLAVEPGSVTPFALFNDRQDHAVTVILDQWMMDQPLLNFHPLENTATTTISNQGLKAFIESCGHTHKIVDLHSA
jgi:Ala-tRNA(Pro) deacylase